MKYIKFINGQGEKSIITFPNSINHDDLAAFVADLPQRDFFGNIISEALEPVSAGFVHESGQCFGRSITLGLKSEEYEDTELLKKQLNN